MEIDLGQHNKVAIVTMVKDEADIIELFIRYHMQFVDLMVILDNFSSDNTVEIIKKLQKENINVQMLLDKDREYRQAEKTANLVNYTLKKFNPDIIIPLDADEFLEFDMSLEELRSYFDNMQDNLIYVNKSFTCRMNDLNNINLVDNKKKYYYDTVNCSEKIMLTSTCWKVKKLNFSEGNHDITRCIEGIYFPCSKLGEFYNSTKEWRINKINNGDFTDDILNLSKENIFKALNDLAGIEYHFDVPLKILHFDYRNLNQAKSKNLLQTLNLAARTNGIITGNGYAQRYLSLKKYSTDSEWFNTTISSDTYKSEFWHINKQTKYFITLKYTDTNTKNDYTLNLLNYGLQLAKDYVETKNEHIFLKNKFIEKLLINVLKKIQLEETIKLILENFKLQDCVNFMESTQNKQIHDNISILVDILPQYAFNYYPEKVNEWFEIYK